MPLLDSIHNPEQLRELALEDLTALAGEIRKFLVETVPANDVHFTSSMGVVELTIALHYTFNTPEDKLVWDVGHQSYIHKILTGRKEKIAKIRQYKGISGYPKRTESPYDPFGAGHASTSISAAFGLAVARDLMGEKHKIISVIGDGSLSGGLAYEGLNNAGHSRRSLLVVLNDNSTSISPTTGAMANYLNAIITNPFYEKLKGEVWDFTGKIPPLTDKIRSLVRRTQDSIKTFILPGLFFEDLGFRYFGPVNGHNMDELLQILNRVKELPGPILLHVLTKKGKGYIKAETEAERFRSFSEDASSSKKKTESPPQAYKYILGQTVTDLAVRDEHLCCITAAMCEGTGLNEFRKKFPERFFDVGIAEEHAVTFAAGLAAAGQKPLVAIYSSFLQRAYDQIIHDVALQQLPVIFAIDQAGLVGEEGPTHHGSFDLSYLESVPNMIVSAPRNGQQLKDMIYTALHQNRQPFAIRYPRDDSPDPIDPETGYKELPIGKWEVLKVGEDILILAVGSMVAESLKAAKSLESKKIFPTLVNCCFVKPMDETLLADLLDEHSHIITLEENAVHGGFGQKVAAFMQEKEIVGKHLHTRGIPDKFVEHGARQKLLDISRLSAKKIYDWIYGIYVGEKAEVKQ